MALASLKSAFKRQLRKNPHLAPPHLPEIGLTVQRLHHYKEQLRAFDAARLELKLASPSQVQRENSAVTKAVRPRIVRFSRHG